MIFLAASIDKKEEKKNEHKNGSVAKKNEKSKRKNLRDDAPGGTKPGKILFILALLVVLLGIGASIELTLVHHRAQMDVASSCDISDTVSCTSIAQTPEAVFLRVPISVWGICTYLVFGILAVWGMKIKRRTSFPWAIFFWMGLATVLYSVWLAYIAYFKYGFFCIWCTVLYVVNMGLMILGIIGVRKSGEGVLSSLKKEVSYLWGVRELSLPLMVVGAGLAGGLIYFYPAHAEGEHEPDVDLAGKISVGENVEKGGVKGRGRYGLDGINVPKVGNLNLIDEDTPMKGARNPDLVVVEFSDYQCPFCAKAHVAVREAFEKYKDRMRVYHRQFPLDENCNRLIKRPYYPHSCNASRAAYCAGQQGKFWELDHLLYMNRKSHYGPGLMRLVRKIGLNEKEFTRCLNGNESLEAVKRDIEVGLAIKMRGTPAFVFFGPNLEKTMVPGLVSVKVFDKFFEALDKAEEESEGQDEEDKAAEQGLESE